MILEVLFDEHRHALAGQHLWVRHGRASYNARSLQPRARSLYHNDPVNRLARERSPYLLQHAANPVDWYPWGDEAFAKARRESKPIFLSIGYSTCHWCHVMEHESFEQTAVAAVLNEHFVSIKVDREERPDVDRVYMTFVQATTGSGGWPMSVWLTPDLKPFYGGTYFPPVVAMGTAWIRRHPSGDRARLARRARQACSSRPMRSPSSCVRPIGAAPGVGRAWSPRRSRERCSSSATRSTSPCGGFGDAPKFPRPSELLFLLREHARTGDERRARDGARHAARDGARRDARPHRRRISPLLGRRRVARAALREDAVRPGAARARVSRRRRRRRATRSISTSPKTRCAT